MPTTIGLRVVSIVRDLYLEFKVIGLLLLQARGEEAEVDCGKGHHGHGTLLAHGVGGYSHEQGEDGATEEAHDHERTHGVGLARRAEMFRTITFF